MDYTKLLNSTKQSKIGIVGVSDGFGYTALVQMYYVNQIQVKAVCALEIDDCLKALVETGYDQKNIKVCHNISEIKNTGPDDTIVVNDYKLILDCGLTSILEATGNIEIGTYLSEQALTNGINVYMVSKETDSFSGAYFSKLAEENNTIYATVNGDQPRNLIDLYSWGKLLGLNIVAAGKSSEYDFVFDKESGKVTYTDGKNEYIDMPKLGEYMTYKDRDTLNKRYQLLKEKTSVIAADVCEMNVVSNVIGLPPSKPTLSYPIVKISELADVFIPKEDGGILDKNGVVDVFYQLRDSNEASFAGGVFLIFELNNKILSETLRSKGHVISKDGKYACIFQPYHMMGVETPLSVILGDQNSIGARPDIRQVSTMVGVAQAEIKKDTTFEVYGHHHEIKDIEPQLFSKVEASSAVPFYLLNHLTLNKDIKEGHLITEEDVDIQGNPYYEIYKNGLSID